MPRLPRWFAGLLAGLLLLPPLLAPLAQAQILSPATPVAAPNIDALPVITPVMRCQALLDTDLTAIGGPGSRVSTAIETSRNGTYFCRVTGTLAPAVNFEALLPTQTWTQRYMQLGCGGLCGRVSLSVGAAQGCVPLHAGGFAMATTDMGHQGDDVAWGDDPRKRIDFAYRGVHITSEAAKALIQRYYGQPQRYAYFNGCSDGGREALMEAQRYPKDFNGIVAGAPAMNFVVQNGIYHAWLATANTGRDGKPILLAARLPLLHKAVLDACDKSDGTKDGLIADPLACHFDARTIQCKADATDTAGCLTQEEVDVVRKFYAGPHDPVTGEALSVGGPLPGSELAWAGVSVPYTKDGVIFSSTIALGALKGLLFPQNPPAGFSLADITFDQAGFEKITSLWAFYNATNPDLHAFQEAGGKLILWHGWADPHISPMNTLAYQKALLGEFGPAHLNLFERLYLLPGVYHCGSGEGLDLVDFLTPVMSWVEKGRVPGRITVAQSTNRSLGNATFGAPSGPPPDNPADAAGKQAIANATPKPTDRTRSLYPFPVYAVYAGKGDIDAAENYRPRRGTDVTAVRHWAGEAFYESFTPSEQPTAAE